jgi:hypothetical protein
MMTGTEHEYSINTPGFTPLPESDRILEVLAGRTVPEVSFGGVNLSKELQKTVIEFVPRSPSMSLHTLECGVYSGIREFYHHFGGRYSLLGLGMHPTLRLDQTAVWDHDEGNYYEVYDRLFGLRQHGWLNIQALQVNIAYNSEREMVDLFNTVTKLIPYLVAISAASPFVEGAPGGARDCRLVYYQKNQEQIPLICNGIIPERLRSLADYRRYQEESYRELRSLGGDCLCEEWVASSGVIIRFSRPCIEIKALDEQECVRSDIAICAFVRSLLRNPPAWLDDDRDGLLDLTKEAIYHGTSRMKPELERLFSAALNSATAEERLYLPVIEARIRDGSLAEQMLDSWERTHDLPGIMGTMAASLRENRPYSCHPELFSPPCQKEGQQESNCGEQHSDCHHLGFDPGKKEYA